MGPIAAPIFTDIDHGATVIRPIEPDTTPRTGRFSGGVGIGANALGLHFECIGERSRTGEAFNASPVVVTQLQSSASTRVQSRLLIRFDDSATSVASDPYVFIVHGPLPANGARHDLAVRIVSGVIGPGELAV